MMTEKMVLIPVPAGPFLMGSTDADERAEGDEKPQRTVHLPDFHIGKYPVTNAEYVRFVQATRACAPSHWEGGRVPKGLDEHPVVNVSWYDALAYCVWLTAVWRESGDIGPGEEVTLPTEAQWEKAARGTDGRIWPWGDEFDAAKCNMYDTGIGSISAVGSFPAGASPYGVMDMAGNVSEWCRTKWRDDYLEPADESLIGDALRVLRGGACYCLRGSVRCAYRDFGYPSYVYGYSGFRVVVVHKSKVAEERHNGTGGGRPPLALPPRSARIGVMQE